MVKKNSKKLRSRRGKLRAVGLATLGGAGVGVAGVATGQPELLMVVPVAAGYSTALIGGWKAQEKIAKELAKHKKYRQMKKLLVD